MNKSFDKKSFADKIEKVYFTLNKDSFQEQIKSMHKDCLILCLESMGNNEHLIKSVIEKGLPNTVFCSKDKFMFCSMFFNFCNVKVHTLLEPNSIIFTWENIYSDYNEVLMR